MLRKTLFTSFFLALISLTHYVRAQDGNPYFIQKQRLQASIARLDKTFSQASSDQVNLTSKLNELHDIDELLATYMQKLERLPNFKDTVAMHRFMLELLNYQLLLDSANKMAYNASSTNILHFIDDDLMLKVDNVRGPGYGFNQLVTVKVRVLNAKQEELVGYKAYAKPEMNADTRLIETFNPTPGAIKDLTPGRKIFWIEKNGSMAGDRHEALSNKKLNVTIDFFIDAPL